MKEWAFYVFVSSDDWWVNESNEWISQNLTSLLQGSREVWMLNVWLATHVIMKLKISLFGIFKFARTRLARGCVLYSSQNKEAKFKVWKYVFAFVSKMLTSSWHQSGLQALWRPSWTRNLNGLNHSKKAPNFNFSQGNICFFLRYACRACTSNLEIAERTSIFTLNIPHQVEHSTQIALLTILMLSFKLHLNLWWWTPQLLTWLKWKQCWRWRLRTQKLTLSWNFF